MSRRPWYKRFGADFIQGTIELTLEEKGAYSVCLDLIYDRGTSVADDPRAIASACGCSVRKWNTIRARLLELGKLTVKDGRLHNPRADRQIIAEISDDKPENIAGITEDKPEITQVDHNENSDLAETPRRRAPERGCPDARYKIDKNNLPKTTVEWSQVSPRDPVLNRPDDPLAIYTQNEINTLTVLFDKVDIESEIIGMEDWLDRECGADINRRKRAIKAVLSKKQRAQEAGQELHDALANPPAHVVSRELAQQQTGQRRRMNA